MAAAEESWHEETPCPVTSPGSAWGSFRAWWPAFFLLALPVGGVYANLALCVALRKDRQHGWKTRMLYPYAMSLACGDLLNCMVVMPTAVINAYIGEIPQEVLLCRVWLAVDLWLTASMGLHLCLLAFDLTLLLLRPSATCFGVQLTNCVRLKLLLAWTLSGVTALGPLLWNLHWTRSCPTHCVPSGMVFSVVSSGVCYAIPVSFLIVCCAISYVSLQKNWRAYSEVNTRVQRDSQREKEIETLQRAVNNFTSISADVDLCSMLNADRGNDGSKQQSLVRKLSQRLSSRRSAAPKAADTPSSPRLDRHPSLRYSIKRGSGGAQASQRSARESMTRKQKSEAVTCTAPLLLPNAGSALSVDSKDYSNEEENSRTPEELDDRTICNMLLAENPSPNRSSFNRRSGSHRGSKRCSKKSLGAPPPSPTLDRHPSLRYSIKRPRTPRPDPDGKKGSFKRSPSTRSQRSFFSRTPSVRSNVSRTPSQHSQSRTPYNRSPQILKMTSLAADYPVQHQAQTTTDTVFSFPEPTTSNHEVIPLLNPPQDETAKPCKSSLQSPVLTVQTATPTKAQQHDRNGRSVDKTPEAAGQEGMLIARANSIESLDGVEGDSDDIDGEALKKQRLMFKVLGVLSLCFALTHLPSYVTLVVESVCLHRHGSHCSQPAVLFALQWIAYACSLLNPLVFFAFHKRLFQKLQP